MKEKVIITRAYQEELIRDPYRPRWHIAFPSDNGMPGDPNGAFFADGVYHLMYLYRNSETDGFHWGHLSSLDLLHWRQHADALSVYGDDKGAYSGGAFVDRDGTAYLTFWKFGGQKDPVGERDGVAIAFSKPPYEFFERMGQVAIPSTKLRGVTDFEINGEVIHTSCGDPSNIWIADGFYYLQTGNKPLLDRFGRGAKAEARYMGDFTDLFRSKDLEKWEYVGRFYENDRKGVDGRPDVTEDAMCPSFLPLYDKKVFGAFTGKYLQLFISHNRGCQYYVGEMDGERFLPENHGRMSWNHEAYFAPEALIDDQGRQILWVWIRDNLDDDFKRFSWSGIFSAPRVVWWENEELRMAPPEELDRLQYQKMVYEKEDGRAVRVYDGESFRIKGSFLGETRCGLRVRVSEDGREFTEIYYSPEEGCLVVDATKSGAEGSRVRECAPFSLREGETLSLDVMVDHSVVEVYANDRQAISFRIYPTDPKKSKGVELLGEMDQLLHLESYAMFPTNPY